MKAWRQRPDGGRFGNYGLASGLAALLWLPLPGLAQLNETGVNRYSDGASLTPEPANYPGQDPSNGRDAAAAADPLQKAPSGGKGFDFTKLDGNGDPLPASAGSWVCVRDNVTGLVWEVKTDDGGLRDKDWRYSWYSTDSSGNRKNPGIQTPSGNAGVCGDTLAHCNTQEYSAAVNQAGLCRFADWRLPTITELRSIVDYDIASPGPAIDVAYFPNTVNDWFWSSSVYAGKPDHAWSLFFYDGDDDFDSKADTYYVRLARGGHQASRPVGSPGSR